MGIHQSSHGINYQNISGLLSCPTFTTAWCIKDYKITDSEITVSMSMRRNFPCYWLTTRSMTVKFSWYHASLETYGQNSRHQWHNSFCHNRRSSSAFFVVWATVKIVRLESIISVFTAGLFGKHDTVAINEGNHWGIKFCDLTCSSRWTASS